MTLSAGQQLRQRREAQKLSLEQAAQTTHIRLQYLEALEADDYEAMPSAVQARGFVRTYAQYLELEPGPLLAAMSGNGQLPEASPASQEAGGSPSQPAAEGQAEAIFQEIGNQLHHQRELLGLSLEDVERHTHLRAHYLQALETGCLEDLPSPVQGRGMLSNYANFLGFDPEPVLLRFADGLQARRIARQTSQTDRRPTRPRQGSPRINWLRRFFSMDLWIGSLLVVFLGAFVIWGVLRISDMRSQAQATSTAPSVADVLAQPTVTPSLQTATLTPTGQTEGTPAPEEGLLPADAGGVTAVTLQPESAQATTTLVAAGTSKVQLYLVARQRAWVRVVVDGEVAFEGRVVPGSAYLYSGEDQVEVLTGNGGALQAIFNRVDLGPMGIFGEIVDRIFTVEGVLTPTPTLTPTSGPARAATPTPSLTQTSPAAVNP